MKDGETTTISLSDYKGMYVVLFWYPKASGGLLINSIMLSHALVLACMLPTPMHAAQDFTFVCPTEIIAFSDRAEEFLDLNTQLIAGSTDTEEVKGMVDAGLQSLHELSTIVVNELFVSPVRGVIGTGVALVLDFVCVFLGARQGMPCAGRA